MTVTVLTIALTYIALLILAIGTGDALLGWAVEWTDDEPLALRFGSAYFVGLAFFMAAVRTVSSLTNNTRVAVWIVLVLGLGFCAWSWKPLLALVKRALSAKWLLYVVPTAFTFALIDLFYWLQAGPLEAAESHVGSLHSVRYAWVANFINASNTIPSLSQNTGQIILVAIGGAVSGTAPFAYLYLWLVSSVVFLALFVFGFVSRYVRKPGSALISTAIFMFGSAALSLAHVLIIDSGSPFAMNGYTDTLFGVFSIFMLLIVNERLKSTDRRTLKLGALATLVCVANFFTAPQNVVYVAFLIPFIALAEGRRGGARYYHATFWTVVLLLAAIIGMPQGGMLTPKRLQSDFAYPGALKVEGLATGVGTGVKVVSPGVPFFYGENSNWYWGPTYLLGEGDPATTTKGTWSKIIWAWESYLASSLRVLFFPIIGIIVLLRLPVPQTAVSKTKKDSKSGIATAVRGLCAPSLRDVALVGAMTFFVGFVGCFLFSLNGYKWELIRFMIPGMSVGLLGVSLLVVRLTTDSSLTKRVLGWAMLPVIFFGPVSNFLSSATFIYSELARSQSIAATISTVLGKGPGL